ncbi:putative Family 53 glycosyl hydrolase [Seiridium cardinale]|uniref:Arabinogalactan endo-beta-1,4-galactanase n=1 Tax=Seiridium cardinale TaxID=138064 RepID=A0ABR2XCL9_9PEZI
MFILIAFLSFLALAAPAPSKSGGSHHAQFYKGHDLSSLKLLEDSGTFFYADTARSNETRPADDILGDGGMNGVRLRIWVNPSDGVYGLDYTLNLAKRFQAKGYSLYLDFHFSDTWADPQKQYIPAAWPTDLKPLSQTLRKYVSDTLLTFKQNGIKLDIVSLGNEIRHGLLWPTGRVDVDVEPYHALVKNFTNAATLYRAARAGLDDAVAKGFQKPQVMIHLDNGWNTTFQTRWYSALFDNGVHTSDVDVFGVSFYPFYGTSATFDNLRDSLNTLVKKYGKPVQVVETDYPAICDGQWNPIPESSEPEIPYNVDGQVEWMGKVIDIVEQVPKGLGQGVWYWEPAWLNNTSLGSNCTDALLFYPDYSEWPITTGYSRESVNVFK